MNKLFLTITLFLGLNCFAQIKLKTDKIEAHVYPIKIKHENKSFWFSVHNYLLVKDYKIQEKGYFDLKFSLRVKNTYVVYYNIFYRVYFDRKKFSCGLLGQVRVKI